MNVQNKEFLSICQVNICNLSKISQIPLEKYIYDNNIDILLVQETKLQIPPNINNYSMESTPSRGMTLKEGGCAIYLLSAIKQSSRLTNLEEEGLDFIWILMKIGTHIVYSWKGVKWDDWKRKLDETLLADVRIDMTINPYELWKYICEDLLKAKDNTVPQKNVCSHSRPYWTESLSHKSLLLRDAQDKYSSWSSMVNREILDVRRIEFESELHDAIDTWTKNNSDNLNTRDKSEFWKAFKRNFKQLDASSNRVDILQKEDGGFIYSNTEKADKLYSTFFTGDHLNGCNFDETFKEEVDAEIKRIASTSQQQDKEELDFNEAYSLEELDAALKKISTANKACDGDGIHPAMIKNMGPVAKSISLKLNNRCLDEGVWPWRSSKVIFLKKPGKKNYQDPAAYRPICLASNTGKLLERLVEPRMRRWMIQQGLIDEEQEGFMHHKSTTRYLYRLIARINIKQHQKQQRGWASLNGRL